MRLILRERGAPLAVSLSDWRTHRLEETVGVLGRSGVIRVERTSAAIILTPRNFVGEMHASSISLIILPKDELLYEAILGLAIKFDGKIAQHYTDAAADGDGEDLATPFVDSLAAALEDGLPWRYISNAESTSRPRGRLLVGKTITDFLSQGIHHRVVARRHERKQIRAFVNVVWAAYRSLVIAPGSTQVLLARAAVLIEALDSQDIFDVTEIASAATSFLLDERSESEPVRALTRAALAILNRDMGAGQSTIFVPAGVAHFVNLERVWERAVAQLVSQTLRSGDASVALHGLAGKGLRLFGSAGPTINPDVTVAAADGSMKLVADAKYKILSDGEADGIASDIYQLTCYADRTRSGRGILVYLGLSDRVTVLGESESGSQMLVIAISSQTLRSYGQDALAYLLNAA